MTSTDALAGRVALVTGAARGIGRAVALSLPAAGACAASVDACGGGVSNAPLTGLNR